MSEVVYQASTLAAELGQARVLVMAQGKTSRRVVRQLSDLGLETCVPVTADKRLDVAVKHASDQVVLGDRLTPGLMANSYAVLQAALKCRAFAVLLCDESLELACVDEFLVRCENQGVLVLKAVGEGSLPLGWSLCEADGALLPDESWVTCSHCGLSFSSDAVRKRQFTCPQCQGYFRMSAVDRLDLLVDEGSFERWDALRDASDPLEFPGYRQKVLNLRAATGLDDAVLAGGASVAGLPCAIAVMDTAFLMGSMGHAVGETLSRMVGEATRRQLPVVIVCASGGARMQEGLISLMQMAKVSCALERHGREGLPYFAVLTDPTTGGVTASFAMQADVILAEPRALIGFAGQRVIRDTIRQELPEGFQTAEFALRHGLIDAVVPRAHLRDALAQLLAIHGKQEMPGFVANQEAPAFDSGECGNNGPDGKRGRWAALFGGRAESYDTPASDRRVRKMLERHELDAGVITVGAERKVGLLDFLACSRNVRVLLDFSHVAVGDKVADEIVIRGSDGACSESRVASSSDVAAGSAWRSVQIARNTKRPTALHYIDSMVDGFMELHGDRMFGDDAAVVAGLGWIDGQPVTVIAQEKGATLAERIRRNFGCAQPEGYRKTLRLMRQAEKFGRPIVCLVDTQGAFCGMQAEERGQGNALADNLLAMAGLRVPVVSVLLGEGGSGGALALALANRVAMQEHAVYSVLSPEGFASILWKDGSRAQEAAAVMRMDAANVHAMGVVDEVISEGPAAAHENPDAAARCLRDYVVRALGELRELPPDELVRQRHQRFARF